MAIHTTYGDWLERGDVDTMVNTVTCVVARFVLPMVSHYPGVGVGFWNCCARFQRVLWVDAPSAAHHGRRRWLWCSKGSLLPCTPALSACAPKCAPETPGLRCISAHVCALVKAISHRGKEKGRTVMEPCGLISGARGRNRKLVFMRVVSRCSLFVRFCPRRIYELPSRASAVSVAQCRVQDLGIRAFSRQHPAHGNDSVAAWQ